MAPASIWTPAAILAIITFVYAEGKEDFVGICRNDSSFHTYTAQDDKKKLNCKSIEKSEPRRLKLCQLDEVRQNCPVTCGLCCYDDSTYSFSQPNGNMRYCKWLKNKKKRKLEWCNRFLNGRMVQNACPKACKRCMPYVPISESNETNFSDSTNSTLRTNSPSEAPTSGPSSPPTPNPSPMPSSPKSLSTTNKPNLVMVITDEHNLRTLSCYRDYLLSKHSRKKVDVWGEGVSLKTPNIDSLSKEGALFTNFYSVAPLCTPSRASIMTGMYPQYTGASANHEALNQNLKTFAEVLRSERGYHTGYIGKWHLDGSEKPLWGGEGREFGFVDNSYRWNRGHWKYMTEDPVTGELFGHVNEDELGAELKYKEHYTTDFLVDRSVEFIKSAVHKSQPFALVLSIPDPHSPNENRPYFRNLYQNLDFKVPRSARQNLKFDPAAPSWNSFNRDDVPVDQVDEYLEEFKDGPFWQNHMQQYFGMVKCVDHNMQKITKVLKDLKIDEDTIVVFTSDHGDLLFEHGKKNKGKPYETSAGVPFIIKYPKKITAGKIIETAYSTVDIAPTLLSLMGVQSPQGVSFHGTDGSKELVETSSLAKREKIIFTYDTGESPIWASAIHSDGYKLTVSNNDVPWLFDINKDPEEMNNYITSSDHQFMKKKLQAALIKAFNERRIPLAENLKGFIFMDKPSCSDNRDVLEIYSKKLVLCDDLGKTLDLKKKCSQIQFSEHCPNTCGSCCKDSDGVLWTKGRTKGVTCSEVTENFCKYSSVQTFCPESCNRC